MGCARGVCEKGMIGRGRSPGPAGSRAAAASAATAASHIPKQAQTSALLPTHPPRRSRRHTPRPSRRRPSRRTPHPPRRPTFLVGCWRCLAGPAPCVGVVGWGLVNECVTVVGRNRSSGSQRARDGRGTLGQSIDRASQPRRAGGQVWAVSCMAWLCAAARRGLPIN